jgi:glucarate dehydratase
MTQSSRAGAGVRRVSGLKITKVKCTPVSVPAKDSYSFSVGRVSGSSRVMVEVETSEGFVGIGETFPMWTQQIIEKSLAPKLVGQNPFDLERIMSLCLPTNANSSLPYVDVYHLLPFAGVEMALWDVMGKAAGAPTALLMGGIYRDKIPFSDYVFVSGPLDDHKEYAEAVAKYAKGLVTEFGSPVVEMKVGIFEPRQDIEMIGLVRQAVGEETAVRVDANCAWTEPTALRVLREFEKFGLANMEEPCSTLAADSRLRDVIKIPISAHTTRVTDVAQAGLDAAVVNPLNIGGFARTRKKVAIAEDLGLAMWLHYRGELGFGTAAYLHFIAANRHLKLPSQNLLRPEEHTLTKEGMPEFRDGVMSLPEGDGLGVTLDVSALEKYNGVFKDLGEFDWLNATGESPPFH